MKNHLFCKILLCTLGFTSCQENKFNSEVQIPTLLKNEIDISNLAIISYDSTYFSGFREGKSTVITNDELYLIEDIVIKCIKDYNMQAQEHYENYPNKYPIDRSDLSHYLFDLKKYKRQYVAIINSKGEKEVWVNCFCETWGTDWSKNIVSPDDGGKCFFNFKVNLATEKYSDLVQNSEA